MMRSAPVIATWTLTILLILSGSAWADTASGVDRKPSSQIEEMEKQLGELRDDVGRLSGRVEKIEAMIAAAKEPQHVTVRLDGALRFGDPKAKIGIVEFSDFQCPFCRRFHANTFPQLQKSYIDAGKLALMVRNFPLDFHANAMEAARAADCIGGQDARKFWDFQGDLFANQNRLGADLYKELVGKYGLDAKKFDACISASEEKKKLADDLDYAKTLGVEGTPTFFIGRIEGDKLVDAVALVGAQPFPAFEQVLNSLSKK